MTAHMTAERLAEIQARHAAATKGPWARHWYEDGEPSEGPYGVHPGCRGEWVESNDVVTQPCEEDPEGQDVATAHNDADATFIANAWQDVGDLLAALKEAQDDRATDAAVLPDILRRNRELDATLADIRSKAEALRQRAESAVDSMDVYNAVMAFCDEVQA